MSILIKGMEMPTSCSVCPMLEGDRMDGLCHAASKWLDDDEHWTWYVYPEGDMDDSKPCNCPLVPVPPHGRLIDADAAIADIRGEILEHQMNGMKGTPFYIEDLRTMWQRLEDEELVPTIIPAEEGE